MWRRNTKAPARGSSGRNSSMVPCYVKGGSFVKPFLRVDSMRSGKLRHKWLPQVASVASGFSWVASLASRWNPPRPAGQSRKNLI
ncbi:Hypothetical Protein RSKD131_4066 [Cereibacter sphaeroides KD131]|nr:Hypothetical Protein RSKD131_4066 [Cereibacter sphaeroides KD131]